MNFTLPEPHSYFQHAPPNLYESPRAQSSPEPASQSEVIRREHLHYSWSRRVKCARVRSQTNQDRAPHRGASRSEKKNRPADLFATAFPARPRRTGLSPVGQSDEQNPMPERNTFLLSWNYLGDRLECGTWMTLIRGVPGDPLPVALLNDRSFSSRPIPVPPAIGRLQIYRFDFHRFHPIFRTTEETRRSHWSFFLVRSHADWIVRLARNVNSVLEAGWRKRVRTSGRD